MTKRQLIVTCHVRNEQFLRELEPIVSLWATAGVFTASGIQETASEGAQDPQTRWRNICAAVGLLKELVDRLDALLERWPHAVWLFFPETGHGGRIRLFHQFYTKTYPTCFPDAPQEVPRRTVWRMGGHRWCGTAPRIRRETERTFHIWDQFQTGRSHMEIARREFPSKSRRRTGKWNKELMVVRRSLERATQLIYGRPLPTNRKIRRLLDFNSDDHLARCGQCRSATKLEQMCPRGRDFVNQDQKS
jgi:hypothetical protein